MALKKKKERNGGDAGLKVSPAHTMTSKDLGGCFDVPVDGAGRRCQRNLDSTFIFCANPAFSEVYKFQ